MCNCAYSKYSFVVIVMNSKRNGVRIGKATWRRVLLFASRANGHCMRELCGNHRASFGVSYLILKPVKIALQRGILYVCPPNSARARGRLVPRFFVDRVHMSF